MRRGRKNEKWFAPPTSGWGGAWDTGVRLLRATVVALQMKNNKDVV